MGSVLIVSELIFCFQVCNGKSQSPIDIVTGATPIAEPTPINFGNYDKVGRDFVINRKCISQIRIDDLSISEEHYDGSKRENGSRLEAGSVKNNGHTAVIIS